MPGSPRNTSAGLLLLLVTVLGILACFADKAFTVDDPLFLWLARHVQQAPLDFFGFEVNWNASQLPMYEITQNPPFGGFVIAAAAALFGWSEVALHLALLIPAAGAVLGTWLLARRYCDHPLAASLVGLLTPVFLVSSTNVMCDTTMLAFWVGALASWTAGFEERRKSLLLLAAVLASLAFLTKYFAIALVPLLLAHGLLKERRLGTWSLFLLLPVLTAVGYDRYTEALYGSGQLAAAAAYAGEFRVNDESGWALRVALGLVFAGACLIPALLFAPLLWGWRTLLAGALLLALGLALWGPLSALLDVQFPANLHALALRTEHGAYPSARWSGAGWMTRWSLVAQFQLFALGGVSLVGLACADLWRRRDPDAAFLFLWLLGTFVFAAFVNWVNNGRSNLPMAPVLGILVVRRLELLGLPDLPRRVGAGAAFAASAAVALLVTHADYRWAGGMREVAQTLAERHVSPDHDTYFLGNWGFQYYLEEGGAIAVDQERFPRRGDRLLAGFNTTDIRIFLDPRATRLLEQTNAPAIGPVRTMSRYVAGFYAHNIGPLPYAWAPGQADPYYVWLAQLNLRFPPRPLYGERTIAGDGG